MITENDEVIEIVERKVVPEYIIKTYADFDDRDFHHLFSSLPINPGYFTNYILEYRYIIEILQNLDFDYCFVEQLHKIYKTTIDNISYNSFLKLIKKGEQDKFWGIFTANKYSILYLKSNSFLCYYRKKRSSLEKDRITTKMLVRSAIIFSMGFSKVERIALEKDEIYKCWDYIGNVKYVALTSSDCFKNSIQKRIRFATAFSTFLDLKEDNTDDREEVDFYVLSVFPLQPSVKEHLTNLLYGIATFYNHVEDVSKYFGGIPIDQH